MPEYEKCKANAEVIEQLCKDVSLSALYAEMHFCTQVQEDIYAFISDVIADDFGFDKTILLARVMISLDEDFANDW